MTTTLVPLLPDIAPLAARLARVGRFGAADALLAARALARPPVVLLRRLTVVEVRHELLKLVRVVLHALGEPVEVLWGGRRLEQVVTCRVLAAVAGVARRVGPLQVHCVGVVVQRHLCGGEVTFIIDSTYAW